MTPDDGSAATDAHHGRGGEAQMLRELLAAAATGDRRSVDAKGGTNLDALISEALPAYLVVLGKVI